MSSVGRFRVCHTWQRHQIIVSQSVCCYDNTLLHHHYASPSRPEPLLPEPPCCLPTPRMRTFNKTCLLLLNRCKYMYCNLDIKQSGYTSAVAPPEIQLQSSFWRYYTRVPPSEDTSTVVPLEIPYTVVPLEIPYSGPSEDTIQWCLWRYHIVVPLEIPVQLSLWRYLQRYHTRVPLEILVKLFPWKYLWSILSHFVHGLHATTVPGLCCCIHVLVLSLLYVSSVTFSHSYYVYIVACLNILNIH